MNRQLFGTLLFLGACILLIGCKPKNATLPAATPAPPEVDAQPATDADCLEFAKSMEKAIREKNRARVDQLLSIEELAIRSLDGIKLTNAQKQAVTRGIKSSVKDSSLAAQIVNDVEKGGCYKLLRVHQVDGRWRALFRLAGTETGVNYHDFVLARFPDGRIAVEDIYIQLSGEMITQSFRRLMLPAAAEMNRGILAELKGTEKVYLSNAPKLRSMAQAVKAGDKKQAIAIYKSFQVELREEKSIMLIYLTAAEGDDVEYTAAIENYRRLFPNDPAVDFVSIDYFLLKKQYDEAIVCIDKTDKALGGDPYLLALRANVLTEAKRYKEATAAAEKAIEQEPDLEMAYWSRITVALKQKNNVDTLAWLKRFVERTGQEVGDLKTVDDYTDFVKSPQHDEWLKWNEARNR